MVNHFIAARQGSLREFCQVNRMLHRNRKTHCFVIKSLEEQPPQKIALQAVINFTGIYLFILTFC